MFCQPHLAEMFWMTINIVVFVTYLKFLVVHESVLSNISAPTQIDTFLCFGGQHREEAVFYLFQSDYETVQSIYPMNGNLGEIQWTKKVI